MESTNPTHYNERGIQPIDYINANQLDFYLGNVIKYITRAGYKDTSMTIKDLEKAKTYIDFKIAALNGQSPSSIFRDNMKDSEAVLYANHEMG